MLKSDNARVVFPPFPLTYPAGCRGNDVRAGSEARRCPDSNAPLLQQQQLVQLRFAAVRAAERSAWMHVRVPPLWAEPLNVRVGSVEMTRR